MGSFRGHLGETTAHLCIDMQRLFAPGGPWATPWMERVLPVVVRLVERAPARTVFTRFITPHSPADTVGTWRRYFEKWQALTRSNADIGLFDLVAPLALHAPPTRIVDRVAYSAFARSELDAVLRASHFDTLVVSGSETDLCVLATVLAAVDRGYRVIIASDAVCSSSDTSHDALIDLFARRFDVQVELAESPEILAAWPT
jgi:nicotinamidase-related amidase